jgi:hypothetical protein
MRSCPHVYLQLTWNLRRLAVSGLNVSGCGILLTLAWVVSIKLHGGSSIILISHCLFSHLKLPSPKLWCFCGLSVCVDICKSLVNAKLCALLVLTHNFMCTTCFGQLGPSWGMYDYYELLHYILIFHGTCKCNGLFLEHLFGSLRTIGVFIFVYLPMCYKL